MAFFHRVGLIALGSALGQGCILVATPFLARTHSPAEFGELALLITVSIYAAAAGCLRFDLALSSSGEDHRERLLSLCIASALAMTVAAIPLAHFIVGDDQANTYFGRVSREFLIGLIVLGVSFYQLSVSYMLAQNKFRQLAILRFSQGAIFAATALFTPLSLGESLAASFSIPVLATLRWPKNTKLNAMPETIRKYKSFTLYTLPGALVDALACSVIIIVISEIYGLAELGNFSQVQRLVGAPLLLISASLFQVYLRSTTEDFSKGIPLLPKLKRLATQCIFITIFIMSFLALFGENILAVVLGSDWRIDTKFILLVVGALAIRVCVSPLSSVLVVTGRLKTLLSWQLFYLITSIVTLGLAARNLSLDNFLYVYLIHESILYILYFLLIIGAARTSVKDN